MHKCMYVLYSVYLLFTQLTKIVQFVLSRLDWTGLTSEPLSRTGLDQDHRLTDLDWNGFFQMNPFHTLQSIQPLPVTRSTATMGPFSPILFIPWLGNGYINRKGLYTAQTKPKSGRAERSRVSLRSGASWAGTGRDGGDPSAAARRLRWQACTLSAEAFRRPHLRFEPPACDTPPPPHPDRHGKQEAAGMLISEV